MLFCLGYFRTNKNDHSIEFFDIGLVKFFTVEVIESYFVFLLVNFFINEVIEGFVILIFLLKMSRSSLLRSRNGL